MAQQGSPPRRPSHQPDPEHRGRGERSPRQDRPKRGERPDRAGWQARAAFGPEDEAELPPWATPSSYQERPGASRLQPAGQRGGRVRNRDADPYADQYADPYADPARADRAREDDADLDGGYRDGAHRGAAENAGDENRGRQDLGLIAPGGEGDRYQGRRRAPDTLEDDREDSDGGSYEPAESAETAAPDAPVPGRRSYRRKGRAAATRLRKSRRRVYRWSEVAIVLVLLAGGSLWLFGRSTPAPTPWVTKLLAGEYKTVPSACTAVHASVLNAYLPASGRTERVSVGGSTSSQCSYTFDKQPAFLVLQIGAEALQPFAAAGNNGSATADAQLSFTTARQALARPPKKSPLPPAMITPLASLGQQAIVAIQHEHVSGIGTDVVTVVIRERNVLITVSLSGQESGHGFGPVPDTTLMAGARAVATSVLARAKAEPTA